MEQDEAWTIALDSLDIPEPGAREALIAMSEIRHVEVGTTIIAQEEDEDHVFILLEGSVRVVLLSENGQEIWLDWFGAGAIFGELAALTGKPRTSEIVAETPCRIAALTGAQFFDLLRRHGSIGLALCRILATRIHHTTQRMSNCLRCRRRAASTRNCCACPNRRTRPATAGPSRSPRP